MNLPVGKNSYRVALGALVVGGAAYFLYWRETTFRINVADKLEIDRVLRPDRLPQIKDDLHAIVRSMRLIAVSKLIRPIELSTLNQVNVESGTEASRARELWQKHRDDFKEIDRLLKEGPLQFQSTTDLMLARSDVGTVLMASKALAFIATILANEGDFKGADKAMEILLTLSRQLYTAVGTFPTYLVAGSSILISDRAVEIIVKMPNCPIEFCRRWLSGFVPVGPADPALPRTIAFDYRYHYIPLLSNPTAFMSDVIKNGIGPGDGNSPFNPPAEDYEGIGTYDPMPTAEVLGKVMNLQLLNASRPLSKYDPTPDEIVVHEARGLPGNRGRRQSVERLRFKWAMNNTRNSIGRALISRLDEFGSRSTVEFSCRWRATHEATAVLVATVLYRREHDGHMPPSLAALTPKYLPSTPEDPFDGQPLGYSAGMQRVWCDSQSHADRAGDMMVLPTNQGMSLAIDARDPQNRIQNSGF